MRTFRIPFRIVFYRENGVWFAHSLDSDLIGEGVSKSDALKALADAFVMQVEFSIENHNMLNIFQPADAKYHEMFAAGKDVAMGQLSINIQVQRPGIEVGDLEAREYDAADQENYVGV